MAQKHDGQLVQCVRELRAKIGEENATHGTFLEKKRVWTFSLDGFEFEV